jgi:uncharacterized protein (UPF0335 family)
MADAANNQVLSFVERIERLNEEKAALAADIREVFAEAKAMGFDVKVLRRIIALRAMDSDDRQEMAALLETYGRAVGLQGDLFV